MKKEILLLIVLILLPVISAQNTTFEIYWDEDDVYHGRDFNVEIDVFNLENKTYDLKVWIESENKTTMTKIYDNEGEKWKSGVYYLNEFFKGPGNFSDEVELRIKEEYKDFTGEATLYLKFRDDIQIDESIEILNTPIPEKTIAPEPSKPEPPPKPPEIIQLSNPIKNSSINNTQEQETIKTNNNLIYESQTEKIKKYSIVSF